MNLNNDVNRVLDLTIDHINKGWVKGQEVDYYASDEGVEETVCIIGGVGLACEAIADTAEYALQLEAATWDRIHPLLPEKGFKAIPSFNDSSKTSKEDVIGLLKDAIDY